MRMKFKPWAKKYISDNENIFIQDEEHLNKFIETKKEVRFELGAGRGSFIHTVAKANPDIIFVGVERFDSVIVSAGAKLKQEPLENLRFWSIDVIKLPDYCNLIKNIDLIYLNFSDPWPKSRHTKRRLTSPVFLNIYHQLLSEVGHIEFKTDNQGLFEYSLSSFSLCQFELSNISLDLHNTERLNIKTEYEIKFSEKGFRINYLEARKR